MLKYAKQISQSEEIVIAPATAQLVQLTISSEIAKRQHIPVPDMAPAAQIVVEAGRSFTMAAEEEASHLSPECARQVMTAITDKVRSLTNDLDLAGRDLVSVSNALRTDQTVSLRTALRDSCFHYNLIVMKILLSLDGQKLRIIKSCGEQLIAEIHSIPQTSGSMKTLVPLFKHFIEDLTQFCYRITDYLKEIKDKKTRQIVENSLVVIKKTPPAISRILQDKSRRSYIQGDSQLKENVKMFVDAVCTIIRCLKNVDIDSATRYLELVLHASIAVAGERSPERRNAVIQTCRKIIKIRSELAKLFSITNQSGESWNHINTLSNQMGEAFCDLNRYLSQTYTSSEFFVDESKPLMNLKTAAQKTILMDSDPQLDAYIEKFKRHAKSLLDVTEYAVQTCKEGDDTIAVLQDIASDISILAPKIIACALSVHNHPGQNVTLAFMNALCKEWNKIVAKLLSIIDRLTDSSEFLKASETHINQDAALSKQAFLNQDAAALQRTAKAMINKAQRVFHVGQKELLKSDNATYLSNLEASLAELEQLLPQIVNLANMAVDNFHDVESQENLARMAQDCAKAVNRIKTIVCGVDDNDPRSQVYAAKKLATDLKGDTGFFDIGVQTQQESSNTRDGITEPDVLLQFVMKEDSLNPDDVDNLVGAKGIRKPPESIKEAIVALADLIMTAMNGEPVEGSITTLAAHCGRIKDMAQQCHSLTDNAVRLRTIDFLVQEMNKLTPTVNDSSRKVAMNTGDAYSIENLRWTARHWADSVIVLGKAFDDFGLAPASEPSGLSETTPSLAGIISAALAGDRTLTEAELDSISLRTTKKIDLSNYCSAACLNSSVERVISENVDGIESVLEEMKRTALALAENPEDEVTRSLLEHLCEQWVEHYQNLNKMIHENQPDTMPNDTELGIPPSKVNVAFEQLVGAAKAGDRSKVQILGNTLSAMTTKMRRISKSMIDSGKVPEYQSHYITTVNDELLGLTPEVIRYGLLVAADPADKEFQDRLNLNGTEWVDKMINLSNVLESLSDGDVMAHVEDVNVIVDDVSPIKAAAPTPIAYNKHPEDLSDPIKAAGYRLSRQETVSEEGSELKEIKSITTKLCDCLQVLTTTHDDINERYEMEDTIDDVKGTVNRILLMRPGQLHESVDEWLESISRVTSHLDNFLKPLLDMISTPKNLEYFKTSGNRVTVLVDEVSNVTLNLQRSVEIGLVLSEKELDDITLVTVTHSHVSKITPLLCDAIQVVLNKSNDPMQRTKFEAIKYQWATKFRLLTIALDDIFRSYCQLSPESSHENVSSIMENIDTLIQSVGLILDSENLQSSQDLIHSQILKLEECKLKLGDLNSLSTAEHISLQMETAFGVYCLTNAILKATDHIIELIPRIDITVIDDNNVSYDPAQLSDSADSAIDVIQKLSKVATANHDDKNETSRFNSLSSGLIEALITISDNPDRENAMKYQMKFLRWLCLADKILDSSDLEKIDVLNESGSIVSKGEDRITSKENEADEIIAIDYATTQAPLPTEHSPGLDPKSITEVSGSQTFSELHFSDNEREVETPEPTYGLASEPPVYENDANFRIDDDIDQLSSQLASDLEADTIGRQSDQISRESSIRSTASTQLDIVDPLEIEVTENPTQSPRVMTMEELQLLSPEPPKEEEIDIATSVERLQEEVAHWLTDDNDLILVVQKLLQNFVNINHAIGATSNTRAHIELIEGATLTTDNIADICSFVRGTLIPNTSHKMCVTDLDCYVDTLSNLSKQFLITCTVVSQDPHGADTIAVVSKQISDITHCLLKLISVSYHVHLSGSLTSQIDGFSWRSVYDDSDDGSVIV